jgi:hypothetical protein
MGHYETVNAEDKGQRAVPMLRRHVEVIVDFAGSTIAHLRYSHDDHFAFMSLCFLSRQIEHAGTILRLIPHRDSALVARSMIEGQIQLFWAAKEPQARGLQWRSFAWVHDWRRSRIAAARGQPPSPEQQQEIQKGLALYGEQFLTRKARHAALTAPGKRTGQDGDASDDPYHKYWRCDKSLHDMSSEAGVDGLYKDLYRPLSNWEHWGPEGVGHNLRRSADSVAYIAHSHSVAAQSLAVAFQCLLQSLQVLDGHLCLGLAERLVSMHKAYAADHVSEMPNGAQTG